MHVLSWVLESLPSQPLILKDRSPSSLPQCSRAQHSAWGGEGPSICLLHESVSNSRAETMCPEEDDQKLKHSASTKVWGTQVGAACSQLGGRQVQSDRAQPGSRCALEKSTKQFPRPRPRWGSARCQLRAGRNLRELGVAAGHPQARAASSEFTFLPSHQQNTDCAKFDKTNYPVSSAKYCRERKGR